MPCFPPREPGADGALRAHGVFYIELARPMQSGSLQGLTISRSLAQFSGTNLFKNMRVLV